MKILNLTFTVLFCMSAIVQYNDPDPFTWIAIYLFGAFMCFRSISGSPHPYLFAGGIAVYFSYALYLLFAGGGVIDWIRSHNAESIVATMQATKPWIEQTREFFGLLLLSFALSLNLILARKKQKQTAVSPGVTTI